MEFSLLIVWTHEFSTPSEGQIRRREKVAPNRPTRQRDPDARHAYCKHL